MKKHMNNINKESPFGVPENYFRDLPDRVMERCQEEEETQSKGKSLVYILKPALSLAAMFIGIAVIAYFAVSIIDQPEEKKYTPNDIARANYETPYSSEEDLIDAFNSEEKIKTEKETDEYIDYLLNEEDIDYGTLIRELKEKEQDTSKK
jgi:hypothetical protein